MAFLSALFSRFGSWFLAAFANWFAAKTEEKVKEIIEEKQDQKQFEVINAANVVKVKTAKTREERIKANESLLNRDKP